MIETQEQLRILILEDEPVSDKLLTRTLLNAGYKIDATVIDKQSDFDATLKKLDFDFVFADYHIQEINCKQCIESIRSIDQELPIIVVSGKIGEEAAAELIRAGANDLLLKESMERLPALFDRELLRVRKRREELKTIAQARRVETQYSNFVSSILEVIPDGVVVMSSEYEPLMVNFGFQQISKNYAEGFGCSSDELQNEILATIARSIKAGTKTEIRINRNSIGSRPDPGKDSSESADY